MPRNNDPISALIRVLAEAVVREMKTGAFAPEKETPRVKTRR
jgi:hypothetical protein